MAPSSLILSRGGIVTYQNDSNSLFLHNGGSNDIVATNSQVGRSKSSSSSSRSRGGGGTGKWQSSSNSQQHQHLLKDVIRPNSRMSSNAASLSSSCNLNPNLLSCCLALCLLKFAALTYTYSNG